MSETVHNRNGLTSSQAYLTHRIAISTCTCTCMSTLLSILDALTSVPHTVRPLVWVKTCSTLYSVHGINSKSYTLLI